MRAVPDQSTQHLAQDDVAPVLQGFLHQLLAKYWERTPTARTIVDLLQAASPAVHFDHLAFRTFGVPGWGIDSIARVFRDFGYSQRDELLFPAKRLRAHWFRPPSYATGLPRVFISELKVHELSPAAQQTIQRYVDRAGPAAPAYAAMCAATHTLPWGPPDARDYDMLAQESEYAAWTLANGYALNHTTVAVHRLAGHRGGISALTQDLQARGFTFNSEDGLLKVSPDGGLVQSSTLSDPVEVELAGGARRRLPGSYIEFAERAVLPAWAHLSAAEMTEDHRREGFEVGNADNIFASTRLAS